MSGGDRDTRSDAHPVTAAEAFIKRYVVMALGLPLVEALWSQATHLFECFDTFSYLAVTSPTKRCGKTRNGELLELLCAHPLVTVSATPAVIFRTIADSKPTLIIDEAEALSTRGDRAEALREILNAGYRSGSTVRRCEAPSYKVREFVIYCPKVIILIGELPDTLADRCIHVAMRRRRNEPIGRFRRALARAESTAIRDSMAEWAEQHIREVADWYNSHTLEWVQDREEELWLPLFAVCAIALPQRLPELKEIAERLARSKAEAEPLDVGVRLLTDTKQIFERRNTDRIATATLVDDLNTITDSPWPDLSHGRPLTDRRLSTLLKPFRIRPENIRFDERVRKGYKRESFADAWDRYLSSDAHSSRYNATESINTDEHRDSASATDEGRSGTQNAETPNEDGHVAM